MKNLLSELVSLLKKEPKFLSSDGRLLKSLITEKAFALDSSLLQLLHKNVRMKKEFFKEGKKGFVVFDSGKFVRFLNLRDFLPDSYTAFEQKIGLARKDTGELLSKDESVVLNWPYKDCILEGGMDNEDEKRDEIFYNETLARDEIDRLLGPKVFTNFKRIDKKGEHKLDSFKRDEKGVIKDNLIIKGNNLLVLTSLEKEFAGKVKLVYIDPPYNTQGAEDPFKYNDSFDHSTWLTFMRNRLEIAKRLLSPDGSIYVQLDYNEIHYCKVLMDEIFGRDNFQREIIWHLNTSSGYKTTAKNWVRDHDSILFYSRGNEITFHEEYRDYNEEYKARFKKVDKGGRRYRDDRTGGEKQYLDDLTGIRVSDVWNDIMSFQQAATSLEFLKFKGQKPEALLRRIIEASSDEGDLVLDYHIGTGTTCAVAHKMGRQYIGIEQMDYTETTAVARLKKVIAGEQGGISKEVSWKGGGDLVYCELKENNESLVKRIRTAETKDSLSKIWEEMKKTVFLSYKIDPKIIDDHAKDFKDLSLTDQKKFLDECLEKNHLYVNLSEMEDSQYAVNEKDKKLNKDFYRLD